MSPRRNASGPGAPTAPGANPARRRRRPREETRRFLLDAATHLLISRLAEDGEFGNPLSAVRIADVLDHLNAEDGAERRAPMTTGAVYQIWPSQADFQSDLLDHVMNVVATLGLEKFQAWVRALMAEGLPYDELMAAMSEYDQETAGSLHEVSLSVGLAALVAPERIRAAEEQANARYLADLGALMTDVIAYGGREMRPGLTIEDLVWVIEAFAAGSEVRARTHPEVVARRDASGRHAFSLANVGMIEALTVPRAGGRHHLEGKGRRRSNRG
jgi:hypothetical protein